MYDPFLNTGRFVRGRRVSRLTKKVFVSIVVAACTIAVACAEQDGQTGGQDGGDTLVVGYAAALTGGLAPFDQPAKSGIEVAVDQINQDGGIAGKYEIDLRIKDMKSDPAVAVTATQELIDDGAQIIITVCDADGTIASGRVAQRRGIPTISTCSTTPTVPDAIGDCAFLASMGDNAQAAVLADYAQQQGYTTAYVLGSPDTGYTRQLPGYFREAFESRGGEIVGEDSFSVGAQDFGPQVTRISNLDPPPDAIMTPAYVPDSSTFMKQLRAAGVDIPVLSTDGNDSPLFIDAGGNAVEGTVLTTHGFPQPGSELEKFYELYEEETGKKADTVFIATGWDTIKVIEAAVEEANSIEPAAICEAMQNLNDVQAATATISYTPEQRVPIKPVALIKVENGEFTFIDQVTPENVPPP
jgi:branched-chain amino acid transport system substrate-binding protein